MAVKRQTIQSFLPGFKRAGLAFTHTLFAPGTLTATTGKDFYDIPVSFLTNAFGDAARLVGVSVQLGTQGTVSGSTSFKVVEVGSGATLYSGSIAYNASSTHLGPVDVRDGSHKGIALKPGAVLRLDVTGISGGAVEANLRVHLSIVGYGVEG